jgi:hypothetical protein
MSVAEPETVQLPIAVEPILIEATIKSVRGIVKCCVLKLGFKRLVPA